MVNLRLKHNLEVITATFPAKFEEQGKRALGLIREQTPAGVTMQGKARNCEMRLAGNLVSNSVHDVSLQDPPVLLEDPQEGSKIFGFVSRNDGNGISSHFESRRTYRGLLHKAEPLKVVS